MNTLSELRDENSDKVTSLGYPPRIGEHGLIRDSAIFVANVALFGAVIALRAHGRPTPRAVCGHPVK